MLKKTLLLTLGLSTLVLAGCYKIQIVSTNNEIVSTGEFNIATGQVSTGLNQTKDVSDVYKADKKSKTTDTAVIKTNVETSVSTSEDQYYQKLIEKESKKNDLIQSAKDDYSKCYAMAEQLNRQLDKAQEDYMASVTQTQAQYGQVNQQSAQAMINASNSTQSAKRSNYQRCEDSYNKTLQNINLEY